MNENELREKIKAHMTHDLWGEMISGVTVWHKIYNRLKYFLLVTSERFKRAWRAFNFTDDE